MKVPVYLKEKKSLTPKIQIFSTNMWEKLTYFTPLKPPEFFSRGVSNLFATFSLCVTLSVLILLNDPSSCSIRTALKA